MNIDLDAIQIRDELATKGVRGIETKDQIIADREALLAYARDLEARVERAWDEGFDRGFYDPLAGSGRDASESPARNPYSVRADS